MPNQLILPKGLLTTGSPFLFLLVQIRYINHSLSEIWLALFFKWAGAQYFLKKLFTSPFP
jgi:hypothetical protein